MSARARAKGMVASAITRHRLGESPGQRRVAFNAKITGAVQVGDYTYIGGRTEIRAVLTPIEIGRYCSIGRDVKIFSAGQAHRFDGLSTYPFFMLDSGIERRNFNVGGKPTVIGNDVWIGSNSVIQAGVRIGDGAVVGAAAVVTTDIEPYSIVAGVPARVIGERFPLSTAREVAASRWWELDFEALRSRYPELVSDNPPLRSWTTDGWWRS